MLTLRAIFDTVLFDLGVENADYAPEAVRVSVLGNISSALQMMQAAGEDFYAREEVTIALQGGVGSYQLDQTIQGVLDHPRIGSRTLMKLTSRTRLDNFGPLFASQLSRDVADSSPIAYFVQPMRMTGDDNTRVTLFVAPTPAEGGAMAVPVIKEPPVYTRANLCAEPSPVPPVPHKYHESILLPIVRMLATSNPLFSRNKDRLPRIEADYRAALVMLGVVDPRKQPRGVESGPLPAAATQTPSQPDPNA